MWGKLDGNLDKLLKKKAEEEEKARKVLEAKRAKEEETKVNYETVLGDLVTKNDDNAVNMLEEKIEGYTGGADSLGGVLATVLFNVDMDLRECKAMRIARKHVKPSMLLETALGLEDNEEGIADLMNKLKMLAEVEMLAAADVQAYLGQNSELGDWADSLVDLQKFLENKEREI